MFDSDIANEVYDYLMENDFNIGTNFVDEFPSSWVDCVNACIYLATEENKPLFKIKIEKV